MPHTFAISLRKTRFMLFAVPTLPMLLAQTSLPESTTPSAWPGILGTRATFMLDVVFAAMFLVVPVLFWSWYQVRAKQRYQLHKCVQLTLAIVLLIAVGAFEVDIRLHGWEHLAKDSPAYANGWVHRVLAIHLTFAVTTFLLWVGVVVAALKKFPSPPGPCAHSSAHRRWGKWALWDMVFTSVTGWIFYYLAFIYS